MIKSSALALAAALLMLAPGLAVAAGPGGSQPRAWVSGTGSDASGCGTIKAPCRTIQYAHDSVVTPGGTIYILDPANYVGTPPVTITHAISIINDGVGAATIVAPNTDAIDIQANATDSIFIKGLVLDGAGTGTNGIKVTSAGNVTVANCTITGFAFGLGNFQAGNGILFAPTSGTVNFDIYDTVVSGNGYIGIYTFDSGGSASGTLRNVKVSNNHNGIDLEASGSTVVVADSVFSQNSFGGLAVASNSGSLSVSNTLATGNTQYDFGQFGGVLTSFQNNVYTTTIGTITKGGLR